MKAMAIVMQLFPKLLKFCVFLHIFSVVFRNDYITIAAAFGSRRCGDSPRRHGQRKAANKFIIIYPKNNIFPK